MGIDPNRYVFTTKQVAFKGSPILFVSHDTDDDWQFFGEEEVKEEDAAVLLLKEIIEIDPSISNVLNMPKGAKAKRSSKNAEWVIIPLS